MQGEALGLLRLRKVTLRLCEGGREVGQARGRGLPEVGASAPGPGLHTSAQVAGRSPRPRSICSGVGELKATGLGSSTQKRRLAGSLPSKSHVHPRPHCVSLAARGSPGAVYTLLPASHTSPATPHTLSFPPTVCCILVHPRWVASGAGSAHQSSHTVTWWELAVAASESMASLAFGAKRLA